MELINAIGRRKNAVARVYLMSGNGKITINNREYTNYFKTLPLQYVVKQPFLVTETEGKYDVKVTLHGGGVSGQAEALRMAISRALIKDNADFRSSLKAEGMLMRDSRMVERKKPGQPKARKKFQFSKR
ncbi:MAG: 30S ribosomal protein S9 [Bacteroidales bacterium]|mgnify:CR=1 FL=1|nr:30S ribosomal protein S9 [Bacteroidales bacterium]MCF8397917.1 30S ribosomal protein S9 [Bacteroidales bacterium]